MTECLGQGGRPCQEVGVEQEPGRRGGATREEGRSLGRFGTDKSPFSRLEKAVWAVCICRESRYLLRFLNPQIAFCHSVKPSLYFS